MTVEIMLTRGRVALVDDVDADLAGHKWWIASTGRGYYARRDEGGRLNKRGTYLHRAVLERMLGRFLKSGETCDHINHNTLDNRRCNLRIASMKQNSRYAQTSVNNKCGYKGVCRSAARTTERWRAQIVVEGKQIYLGSFDDAEQAARAYDRAALHYFGEFAWINFPDSSPDSR